MKLTTIQSALVVVALGATTAGCHIYQKFDMPTDTALTQEYVEAKQQPADSTSLGALPWQQVFTDPMLADLISQALANNTNLQNAKLNVDVAHANMLGARLAFLPSVALAPQGQGASVGGSPIMWSYTLPLSVSWEVDIFGKTLNSKRSAEAAYQQTKDYEQAVRSQIIAGVANCYYAISALKAQLELQRATAQSWEHSVQVMKDFWEAGNVTQAAVVQSSAQYYGILASIKDLETSLDETYSTMSLLLNVMPQEWDIPAGQTLTLPVELQQGVPMSVLASRPDVRAAEQSLAVAYYATNSARAAFYPSVSVSATGGINHFSPTQWFYNLAGSLTAPLFARGQNIARLKATKAQQQQAMNNFQYSLMSAAAEVGDALTAYSNLNGKIGLLQTQVEFLAQSVEITELLMANPSASTNTTYLEVLTAQQSLLGAQTNFITCHLNRSRAIVNLYQAMGGGKL